VTDARSGVGHVAEQGSKVGHEGKRGVSRRKKLASEGGETA